MSTANNGISRFESSTVYAPVIFNEAITSETIITNTIEAVSLTLNADVGVYLGGALAEQDATNASAPAVLVLANIPFCASYLITAARAYVLPDTDAGTMPQGVRMTFMIAANVVVTFTSALRIIENFTITNGGLAYVQVAAGNVTANLGDETFCEVTSANDRWILRSFAV